MGEGCGDPLVEAALRRGLGLNKPAVVQYFYWVVNLLQGDLGQSVITYKPAIQMIAACFPAT
jgi:ABC-type dipeptide/oligopeptide/nickel transport system permease component